MPKRIKSIPYQTAGYCCLSPDANNIYFIRRRFPLSKHWSFHRCIRKTTGWSLPEELGPPFSLAVGGFSVAADNSIYFWGRKGGSDGRGGLLAAPFVGNTWAQAIKIPVEMGNLRGCHPGIAPDGSFLVFYSIEPGARGGTPTDLYLTLRRPDDTWTKPQRMGPGINTGYHEIAPRISADKKYMFFTRSTGWNLNHATDTADIYWVELKEHLPESHR